MPVLISMRQLTCVRCGSQLFMRLDMFRVPPCPRCSYDHWINMPAGAYWGSEAEWIQEGNFPSEPTISRPHQPPDVKIPHGISTFLKFVFDSWGY